MALLRSSAHLLAFLRRVGASASPLSPPSFPRSPLIPLVNPLLQPLVSVSRTLVSSSSRDIDGAVHSSADMVPRPTEAPPVDISEKHFRETYFSVPDDQKRRENLQKNSRKECDDAVPEDVVEDIYAILTAPVEQQQREKLLPTDKRSMGFVESLDFSFVDTRDLESEDDIIKLLDSHRGVKKLRSVNTVIYANSLIGRTQEAEMAFLKIQELGFKPDVYSWAFRLNAHANGGDLEKALEVFKAAKESNVKLNTHIYSIMIKACVNAKEVEPAFKFYEEMRDAGLEVPQPVFATLIKGCIRVKAFDRALKTFDYMRMHICSPDEVTYTAMINLCAKTGQVERAFDLFTEMREAGLCPTDVTFNNLIQACGSREDYYEQGFDILEKMMEEGFQPDKVTYNILIGASARQGDIRRARVVWNDMIERQIADKDFQISESTLSFLLSAYAQCLNRIRRGMPVAGIIKDKDYNDQSNDALTENEKYFKTNAAPAKAAQNQSHALSQEQGMANEADVDTLVVPESTEVVVAEDAEQKELANHPMYLSQALTRKRLLSEARKLFNYIDSPESPFPHTTRSFNNYLEILARTGQVEEALDLYEKKKSHLCYDGITYTQMLRVTTKFKDSINKVDVVWQELKAWDESEEAKMGNLTEKEKEEVRLRQFRGKNSWWNFYRLKILGHARVDDLESAFSLISEARDFRHPYYLPQLYFRDVWPLLQKCLDEKDEGNLRPLRTLKDLMPEPPTRTALDEVDALVQKKYLNRRWWGWDAMEVDPDKLSKSNANRLKDRKKAKADKTQKQRIKRAMSIDRILSKRDILVLKPKKRPVSSK